MKNLVFGILLLMTSTIMLSQEVEGQEECGVGLVNEELNRPYLELMETTEFLDLSQMSRLTSNEVKLIPLRINIVRYDNGSGGLTISQLNSAINKMNEQYSEINLEFFICGDINYINSSKLYTFKTREESELAENDISDLVNIYFVNTIHQNNSSLCGYAYYPYGPQRIIMKNNCAMNESTLGHEMGHFFGLLHTHGNGNKSFELVTRGDGANCISQGDGLCDTAADPKLSNGNVSSNCTYTGDDVDANGDTYVPDPENMMSYSRKYCRTIFSPEQYAKILTTINGGEKNNHSLSRLNCDVTLTTSSYTNTSFKLFPNPTDNTITIIFNRDIKIDVIRIYNISGQLINRGYKIKNDNGNIVIDVKELANGQYFVNFNFDGNVINATFIKK